MKTAKNTEGKRAAIYCRVSTREQVDAGNSLTTQQRICREYAAKNGYEIDPKAVFIEEGESAKTIDRTELRKMLEYCAQKKSGISVLIIYKIDRLSRQSADYGQIKLLLRRYGVEIKSTSEAIDDNPTGRLMESMMANFAQFDNDVRAERCTNGMRDAVRAGRYVWMAPIGYQNLQVGGDATIAPSSMAGHVLRSFELVAEGLHPVDEVWRIMCREGLKTKSDKPPTRGYFHAMLRNELFTGWINKFDERYKGAFEPIISEDLFSQVQRMLKNKGHKVTQYKTDNPEFPLRRFVFSPSGLKLTGSFAKGKYPSYRFTGISGNYKRDEFEEKFVQHMDSFQFDADQIERLKTKVRESFQRATVNERKTIQELERQLVELGTEETILVGKNMKGVLSDEVVGRELQRVENARTEVQTDLILLRENGASPEEAIEYCESYLRQPSSIWRGADISIQTKLQWFQFPAGLTFDGEIFGTKEIVSVFKAKGAITAPLSSRVDRTGFEPATLSLQMRCSTN